MSTVGESVMWMKLCAAYAYLQQFILIYIKYIKRILIYEYGGFNLFKLIQVVHFIQCTF